MASPGAATRSASRPLQSSLVERSIARHIFIVVVVAAIVRLTLLRLPLIWYDEATSGLLGLAVLRGELPVYFFGQPFMGALDGYLAAPLYVALGVSARTLKLLPVLVALVWLGLVVRLTWEAFGARAARFTAVLLAVPPDFLLYWSHQARAHYPLSMCLGTLALLLAVRVPGVRGARAAAHWGLLGLVLGLGFWTNFLTLAYVPALAILLLRRGLRPLWPWALVGVPAFIFGSLPHWLYGLQHGTALPPAGRRIGLAELVAHLEVLARVSWPIVTGVPAPLRGTAGGVALAVSLALAYATLLAVAARALRQGAGPAGGVALALATLAVVNVGMAVGTQYGRMLDDHDQKYLLPLYTALPPLLGLGLARLPWRSAAAALATGLFLVHAAGALTGSFLDWAPSVAAAERAEIDAQAATIRALEREGPRRLYAPDVGTRTMTFLSGERVIFSNHYQEPSPYDALAVDGAADVGWWTPGPSPALEANFAAVGARFAFHPRGPLGGAYGDFSLAPTAVRELDPARFSVTASSNTEAAPRITDRDAETLWSTVRPQRGGEWIQVDLGTIAPVALVRWLPGAFQEVPAGLALDTSVDGQAWQRRIELPQYVGPLYWSGDHPMARVRSGRIELRVPSTPARYLRVTQTGQQPLWPWTIRELWVYAATGEPAVAVTADGAALARTLRASGVTWLYADHGWASRVALADPSIHILPANLYLDAYGFRGSALDLLPPVPWGPGRGALVEAADADGFVRAARAAGLAFTERPIGGLTLFAYAPPPLLPGAPVPDTALRVTASRHSKQARLAIDGNPKTRWATGLPQRPGDWVRIDLATPRAVRAVRLWTAYSTDSPRGLLLEGSMDGVIWQPIPTDRRTEGPHRWTGFTLINDGVETVRLDFAPLTLSALRLTLTRGDPVFDWSIHELTVYEAEVEDRASPRL